jgi:uncharacterized protein (TIGR03032 family)
MTHTDANQLEMMGSRQFNSWLKEQRISLVFTTYQAGKIFLIGLQPDGRLSIFERTFNRSMGLWASSQTLWMSSLYQLWRLENALSDRQIHQGYDRLYVPQIGYTTGDLDIHDVAIDSEGKVLFVNTLFSCLATVSQQHSFIPLWKPPFISKLAAEDRCHLNGLAMENGQPRYLSAIAKTDVADGWRDRRRDGGCIIDVKTNEIVVNGLSMPHSPRVYKNRLWVLNSGTGYLGTIDLKKQKFEPLTFCPGYLRGLAFVDNFAVVGLSQPRENKTFSGLPLDDNLQAKNAEARCGLMVIEINTGDIIHWLRITGIVRELYDVAILPGVSRPMALGFKSEEIRRNITIG